MDFFLKIKNKQHGTPGSNGKKLLWLVLSIIIALLIFFIRPLGMDWKQSAVIGILIMIIIWWSTNLVSKIVSSVLLLVSFILLTQAPLTKIFSFPLSNSFLLIALTYVFSRGISNSKIAEKILEPLLSRFVNTPFRAMIAMVLMFAMTMYIIPQPLARLIILANIFEGFLSRTNAKDGTKEKLMFSVFVIYIFINMCTLKADIILNTLAVRMTEINFTDIDWIKYMAVPSLIYLAFAIGFILLIFRNDLWHVHFMVLQEEQENADSRKVDRRDITMLCLLAMTAILWMTESLHGIPAWLVTLISIIVMAVLGVLKLRDIDSLDVSMLFFLTAAMSIGGVMKANGTADLIFNYLGLLIPNSSQIVVVTVIMVITICMHMVLGSNSTTISVVVPGLLVMCSGMLPDEIIMCIVYVTLATQWLFPFHSVAMMVGVSRDSFPSRYILKMGIPMTVLVFAAIFGLYITWWHLLGLM